MGFSRLDGFEPGQSQLRLRTPTASVDFSHAKARSRQGAAGLAYCSLATVPRGLASGLDGGFAARLLLAAWREPASGGQLPCLRQEAGELGVAGRTARPLCVFVP